MPIMKTRRRSPFNLPSAWSPGMALPENVIAEGLERRGLVTQWAPRGTFDNPAVGTGGYVVPEYIQRERYGRGTFVTKWSPRGSYFGPGLPDWLNYPVSAVKDVKELGPNKTEYVMESLHGMGSTDPASLQAYGERAAAIMIASVRRLPVAQRPAALRREMNKLDRSLWSRTAAIASSLQKQGWAPADALQQGLARAMSAGLAAEVIKTGERAALGKRPGALGYLSGLGADAPTSSAKTKTSSASTTATFVGSTPECYNPPPGFTWVAATGTTPAHWERVRVGQTAVKAPEGCYTITGARAAGGITGATAVGAASTQQSKGPMVQCGPWLFPADVDSYVMGTGVRDHRTGAVKTPWGVLPASWQAAIAKSIYDMWNASPTKMANLTLGNLLVPAAALGINPMHFRPLRPRQKTLKGGVLHQTGWLPLRMFPIRFDGTNLPAIPIFRTMHPVKKIEYGVFMRGTGPAGAMGVDFPTTAYQPGYGAFAYGKGSQPGGGAPLAQGFAPRVNGPLVFEWKPVRELEDTRSTWDVILGAIWDAITFVPSVLVTVVETVADALEAAACAVLTSTAGQAGVVAAGAAAAGGGGAVLASTGAQIAANAVGCKATEQTPLEIPPPPGSGHLLPLAIAGAAVGGAYLLSRRKR